jgi:hypothetical protein
MWHLLRALTVVSEEAAVRPQVTDKSFPWPEMRNKRARKSRVALRPVPDGDDKQLPVEGSQSMAKRVSKPLTNIRDLLHLISNNVVAPILHCPELGRLESTPFI